MIVIYNNTPALKQLSVKVGDKKTAKGTLNIVTKRLLGGANIINDKPWEEAIQKDADFISWCENKTYPEGHHLDPASKKIALYTLVTFDKDGEDKAAGESRFRFILTQKLVEVIGEMGSMVDLQLILDEDPRPAVTAAARKRMEIITKPVQKTSPLEG